MASSQAVRQDRSEPLGGSGHSRTNSRVSGKKFSKRELEEIQQAFMRPDPDVDRRIVQGMLSDPDALIKDLAREGITKNLVLRRAADCGISEAVLRQIKRVAADLAGDKSTRGIVGATVRARQCLSCERVFLSTSCGNRLCNRCRTADAGLAAP